MRKLLNRLTTLLLLALAATNSQAATTDVKYVLSNETYVASPTAGEWQFQNGLAIVNGKEKAYAKGVDSYMKFSRNQQFTITLPAGLAVSTITFQGYDNYADADAYIRELNGTTYAETDYVFPAKTSEDPDNPDVLTSHIVAHTISFATPVTDQLTFTAGGQQVAWTITIEGQLTTDDSGQQGTPTTLTISEATFVDSLSIGEWNFQDGVGVTNEKAKGFSKGLEQTVKFSKGVQFTITLPEKFTATSIVFKGYGNEDANDTYLAELNGTTYAETDYVFPHRTDSKHATLVSHEVPFATPTTGAITFTAQGAQAAWLISVKGYSEDDGEQEQGTPAAYTISETTFVDSLSIGEWNFQDGIGVVNEKAKGFSKGLEQTVKFSKGVQFTISLPEKFTASQIIFKGYGNEDANDAYVFPHRTDSKHATLATHAIDFATPVSGQITFTAQGAQAAWIITVKGTLDDDGSQPQGEAATFAIAASNYVESPTATEWSFKDGLTVVNEKDKAYGTGKEDGVKFSAGVQHTIKLPANFLVQQVTFKGYDNYGEVDAYIRELNGTTFGETDYVFPMKTSEDPDNPDVLTYHVVSHTINLSTPASGQLTFTTAGKQVVCTVTLKGIIQESTVSLGDANEDGNVDVTDVMCIVYYVLGQPNPTFNFANANINGDEVVDVTDAMILVNILLGKPYEPQQ